MLVIAYINGADFWNIKIDNFVIIFYSFVCELKDQSQQQ